MRENTCFASHLPIINITIDDDDARLILMPYYTYACYISDKCCWDVLFENIEKLRQLYFIYLKKSYTSKAYSVFVIIVRTKDLTILDGTYAYVPNQQSDVIAIRRCHIVLKHKSCKN